MQASAASLKPPITVWLFIALAWFMGWWMVYDGLHQRLLGDYVRLDGQLGPWAALVTALGGDPNRLSMAFVAYGLALVGASFGVYLRRRWGYRAGVALSVLGLLYLGFGTPVALACLVLLALKPTRDYVAAG